MYPQKTEKISKIFDFFIFSIDIIGLSNIIELISYKLMETKVKGYRSIPFWTFAPREKEKVLRRSRGVEVTSRDWRKLVWGGMAFLLFLFIPCANLYALILPFEIFTDNGEWGTGGSNFGDPALDLIVDVYNGGPTVSFEFHNNSVSPLVDLSITDIYFDDGTLLAISGVENGPGVSFTELADPAELPGANILIPPFETTNHFSADADPPPSHSGVEPGEWVIIHFDLQQGGTLQHVLDELSDGSLRIGIHIQSFPGGSSESAVNVPEPATICLLGLGVLALLRKRRS